MITATDPETIPHVYDNNSEYPDWRQAYGPHTDGECTQESPCVRCQDSDEQEAAQSLKNSVAVDSGDNEHVLDDIDTVLSGLAVALPVPPKPLSTLELLKDIEQRVQRIQRGIHSDSDAAYEVLKLKELLNNAIVKELSQ